MAKKEKVEVTNINDEEVAEKEITPKKRKSPNRKITEQQDKFCMLIAHGTEPLEAMLQVYPNRKKYNKGNQNQILKQMLDSNVVKKRLEELYSELRQNEVLGDMYDFDKGVHLLLDNIRLAKERIENEMLTESLHRIILTSVQELNRMYGFNIIDKDGNKAGTMNVTFVNVNEVTADMMEVSVDGKK